MGRNPSSWSSKHRSSSAALISDALPNPMTFVSTFIAVLMGVKKPRAAGRMMDACRNLPTRVWRAFNGTDFCHRMRCVSQMYAVAFSGGSWMVRLMPINVNPIVSFVLVKLPSPCSSFLIDNGSFPFWWPVTAGSGNTACTPWIDTRLIVGIWPPFSNCVAACKNCQRTLVGALWV